MKNEILTAIDKIEKDLMKITPNISKRCIIYKSHLINL